MTWELSFCIVGVVSGVLWCITAITVRYLQITDDIKKKTAAYDFMYTEYHRVKAENEHYCREIKSLEKQLYANQR